MCTFLEYAPIKDSTDDESRLAVLHKELCLSLMGIPRVFLNCWCNLYIEI